jgi:hypothetical protein
MLLRETPNTVRVIKSRKLRWVGRVVYRVLVGKPEGNRPVGRARCRWEDNIKLYKGK